MGGEGLAVHGDVDLGNELVAHESEATPAGGDVLGRRGVADVDRSEVESFRPGPADEDLGDAGRLGQCHVDLPVLLHGEKPTFGMGGPPVRSDSDLVVAKQGPTVVSEAYGVAEAEPPGPEALALTVPFADKEGEWSQPLVEERCVLGHAGNVAAARRLERSAPSQPPPLPPATGLDHPGFGHTRRVG